MLLPLEVLTLPRQERVNFSDAPKKLDKPMEESLSSPENRVYKESVNLEMKIASSLSTYWYRWKFYANSILTWMQITLSQ